MRALVTSPGPLLRLLLRICATLHLLAALAVAQTPAVTPVPWGTTWALQAWGLPWDAPADPANGRSLVVVDVDGASASEIASFQASGLQVMCYFSVGTLEGFRADAQQNSQVWERLVVAPLAEWDEQWLRIGRLDDLKIVMEPRFQRAAAKGCDGVEPDNIDCYTNSECYQSAGYSVSVARAAQIAFSEWQVTTAHALGLSIGMKNAITLASELEPLYDWAMNEECHTYNECQFLAPFFASGKAIFNVEYNFPGQDLCARAAADHTQTKYCSGNGEGLCVNDAFTDCFAVAWPVPPLPAAPIASWAPLQLPFDADTAQPQALVLVLDLGALSLAEADVLRRRGHILLCAFSATAYVPGVPGDNAEDWVTAVLAPEFAAYSDAGYTMLDLFRQEEVRGLMAARLDTAVRRGCDGVLLQELACGSGGCPFAAADFLAHAEWTAVAARAYGILAGAQGLRGAQLAALEPSLDLALLDGCLGAPASAAACAVDVQAMADAGKPVLVREARPAASDNVSTLCEVAAQVPVAATVFDASGDLEALCVSAELIPRTPPAYADVDEEDDEGLPWFAIVGLVAAGLALAAAGALAYGRASGSSSRDALPTKALAPASFQQPVPGQASANMTLGVLPYWEQASAP